jgi:hypothetical protein
MSVEPLAAENGAASEVHIDLRRLLWVGPLAIILAVLANVLVATVAPATLPIEPGFLPLTGPGVVAFTVIGVGAAIAVFALVARISGRPIRTFRIIALVALVLSLLPDLLLLTAGENAPFTGITPLSVGVLMLMHVVAAAISVGLLTTLTRGA